jgi:hypothetical protein
MTDTQDDTLIVIPTEFALGGEVEESQLRSLDYARDDNHYASVGGGQAMADHWLLIYRLPTIYYLKL